MSVASWWWLHSLPFVLTPPFLPHPHFPLALLSATVSASLSSISSINPSKAFEWTIVWVIRWLLLQSLHLSLRPQIVSLLRHLKRTLLNSTPLNSLIFLHYHLFHILFPFTFFISSSSLPIAQCHIFDAGFGNVQKTKKTSNETYSSFECHSALTRSAERIFCVFDKSPSLDIGLVELTWHQNLKDQEEREQEGGERKVEEEGA